MRSATGVAQPDQRQDRRASSAHGGGRRRFTAGFVEARVRRASARQEQAAGRTQVGASRAARRGGSTTRRYAIDQRAGKRTSCSPNGGVSAIILVRAKHSRKLSKTEKLFDSVRAGPSETCYLASESATQGQQTQSDGRTQGTRRGDPFRPVAAGRNRAASRRSRERAGTAAPNRWFLRSPFLEDAMRIVDWYALRWRIEDWHRSLKSGCEVEETGHHTAARLERVINAVIAWRIMLMALLARKTRSRRTPVLRLGIARRLRDKTAANAEAQDAQRSGAYRGHHGWLP